MNENFIAIAQIVSICIRIGPIGPVYMVLGIVREIIVVRIRDIETFIPIVIAIVVDSIEQFRHSWMNQRIRIIAILEPIPSICIRIRIENQGVAAEEENLLRICQTISIRVVGKWIGSIQIDFSSIQ